jgi:hypothetical protein
VQEDLSKTHAAILDLAVEGLRLGQRFERAVNKLDAGEARPFVSQIHYHRKRTHDTLEAIGLRLVDLQGQDYDPGMPVRVLNIDEFGPGTPLTVQQMVEPIVMGPNGVERTGAVLVGERR